jgi:hypothetical protein
MTVRRIDYLTRLTNTVNGNPRFRVHFTDGSSAVTSSDASFAYGLGNPENLDNDVEVTFTKAGRISDLRPVKS